MFKKIFYFVLFMFQIWEISLLLIYEHNTCSNENMENLNMEKMLGRWYAVKRAYVNPNSTCSVYNIKRNELGEYLVEQCNKERLKEFKCWILTNLTTTQNLNAKIFLNVIDTDYDHYADILTCDKTKDHVIEDHLILSRNQYLLSKYADKILDKKQYDIYEYDMKDNDLEECPIRRNSTGRITIHFYIYLIALLMKLLL